MNIEIVRATYAEVEPLRELFREEAKCQIVYDSILRRGLADAYRILIDGRIAGYGGIWNSHDPGSVMEFYVLPDFRRHARDLGSALIASTGAPHVEAQTNIPWMLTAIFDHAHDIVDEKVLFSDQRTTEMTCAAGTFRKLTEQELGAVFAHAVVPVGDWGIESGGKIVATGGFLTHYNPPYADIFMEVSPEARNRGFGSYLVQELKRVCYEAGCVPAARCDVGNVASRGTLEKAGLLPSGRMLKGTIGDQ